MFTYLVQPCSASDRVSSTAAYTSNAPRAAAAAAPETDFPWLSRIWAYSRHSRSHSFRSSSSPSTRYASAMAAKRS